jgi:tetratricopeptide (TPR) repeat protein
MAERDFTEIARLSERYNKDPQSRIFVQLADAYRKNNMIEEAFEVLQKGLEHHPEYPLAHLIMGKCRFDKRMFAQAKESFQKTLEFDPQNVVALRMLAQTCEITNDEAGQIAAYKGLLTIDPFDDQAKEKLSILEAKQKKEPMLTFAMAEEYEKQGDLDKALEIYQHLQSADPSDLVIQKKVTDTEAKITEQKKAIEAKKIESMQVETVFKPEQIEENLQEAQKPKQETIPPQPRTPPAPGKPAPPEPDIREDVMPLEDFLAESKEGPPVAAKPEPTAKPDIGHEDKDIIDEKLDLLEPFKPEEPADKIEKLDILEPVETDTPAEPAVEPGAPSVAEPETPPVQETPAPPPPPPPAEPAAAKEPVPQPVPEKPAPKPEPAPAQPVPETPVAQTPPPPEPQKEDVIILQPPAEPIPEPTVQETPAPPPPPAEPAAAKETPPAAPEAASTPLEPKPAEVQPTPVPQAPEPVPEPKPAEAQPTPPPQAPEPAPQPVKEEPKPKPKEEDFQSFQDWLSGLLK